MREITSLFVAQHEQREEDVQRKAELMGSIRCFQQEQQVERLHPLTFYTHASLKIEWRGLIQVSASI